MKRTRLLVVLVCFGAGCGLDTAGLEDRSHQPGSTMSQHAEAGVAAADASLPPDPPAPPPIPGGALTDAQPDAADAGPPECRPSTCGPGMVCCAHALGGGKTARLCASDCDEDDAVTCDLVATCDDGDCKLTLKYPGVLVCD